MPFTTEERVIDVQDKKSGALIWLESTQRSTPNNPDEEPTLLARHKAALFLPGFGGFGDAGFVPRSVFPPVHEDEKPIKTKKFAVGYN